MTTTDDRPSASHDDHLEPRLPFGRNPRHFGIDPGDPWPDDVPMDQDDRHWRYEGNPRGAKWAERRIAACWTVTALAAIAVCVVYQTGANNQLAGLCWGLAFGGLGIGMILWARDLLPGHDVIASRGNHAVSHAGDRVAVAESFSRGTDAMARRPFLVAMLGGVGGLLGIGALYGPVSSLGPRPHTDLYRTKWGPLVRAVTEEGKPIKPSDLPVNGILTVFPEGNTDDALSPTLLINVGSDDFQVDAKRANWTVNAPTGRIVAFSKICTHAGCPASLYNVQKRQLNCPCHQSVFDVLDNCKPVSGPAPRALAQLALDVNEEGYIVSQSDYTRDGGGPVGPGFWNRG